MGRSGRIIQGQGIILTNKLKKGPMAPFFCNTLNEKPGTDTLFARLQNFIFEGLKVKAGN
jgi:hypothetical protein